MGSPEAVILTGIVALTPTASASEAPVGLGTAAPFAVLAGSAVTNVAMTPTVVDGDLGTSPGGNATGFGGAPNGTVTGTTHLGDAVADLAQDDLTTAYNDAAGRASTLLANPELGNKRLVPGVYSSATLEISDAQTLTLDAEGDPGAVFIVKAASTLVTGVDSAVALANAATVCNVFWQVGSSATLDTGTQFKGTVMAAASITVNSGARIIGRALARAGAVTLDNNVIRPRRSASTPTGPSRCRRSPGGRGGSASVRRPVRPDQP